MTEEKKVIWICVPSQQPDKMHTIHTLDWRPRWDLNMYYKEAGLIALRNRHRVVSSTGNPLRGYHVPRPFETITFTPTSSLS